MAVKAIITLLAIIFLENEGWFLHLLSAWKMPSKILLLN